MELENKMIHKLSPLVIASLNGTITEEEYIELNSIIKDVPGASECYIDILWTYVGINSIYGISSLKESSSDLESLDYIEAMLEEEAMAPAVEMPKECLVEESKGNVIVLKDYEFKRTYRIFSMIISSVAVLMFLFIAYANIFPVKQTAAVGIVTDQIEVKWSDTSEQLRDQDKLFTNHSPYSIDNGLLKINYIQGVDIIIEGPAVFLCKDQNSIRLISGKAYTRVSQGATGFTIITPSCDVIDLGTEFGVNVQKNGNAIVQMYKGKASVVSRSAEQIAESVILKDKQARLVQKSTGRIYQIQSDPESFIRHIDQETHKIWNGEPLALGDVVGGGDGFGGGESGAGIDPETGRFDIRYVRPGRGYKANKICWSPVPSNRYVNCVFVTDGSEGPQKVSTDGHRYEFIETDRRFHHDIFYSNSPETMLPADDVANGLVPDPEDEITLDGISYGVEDHPAIFIHAPSGITFDLQAIRKDWPGLEISSFGAVAGISDIGRDGASIDIVVLVDGVCVFEKKDYTVDEQTLKLNIPIAAESRYLTLAVTDAGDDAWFDLCVFGDPCLQLKLAE